MVPAISTRSRSVQTAASRFWSAGHDRLNDNRSTGAPNGFVLIFHCTFSILSSFALALSIALNSSSTVMGNHVSFGVFHTSPTDGRPSNRNSCSPGEMGKRATIGNRCLGRICRWWPCSKLILASAIRLLSHCSVCTFVFICSSAYSANQLLLDG